MIAEWRRKKQVSAGRIISWTRTTVTIEDADGRPVTIEHVFSGRKPNLKTGAEYLVISEDGRKSLEAGWVFEQDYERMGR